MKEHKLEDKFNPKNLKKKFIKDGREKSILNQVKIRLKSHIQ